MMVERSQVTRNFIRNAIQPDLRSIPHITQHIISQLKYHNITTTDQIVGYFFSFNRSQMLFVSFLKELGIDEQFSIFLGEQLGHKFQTI